MTEQQAIIVKLDNLAEDIQELKKSLNTHNEREASFSRDYARDYQILKAESDAANRRLDDTDKRLSEMSNQIAKLYEIVNPVALNYVDLKKKIDETATNLANITKAIQPLIFWNRIFTGIAAAFGVSIVGLIWSIILGQVHITIP